MAIDRQRNTGSQKVNSKKQDRSGTASKSFIENLGAATSSYSPENKGLIDSEVNNTSNRLKSINAPNGSIETLGNVLKATSPATQFIKPIVDTITNSNGVVDTAKEYGNKFKDALGKPASSNNAIEAAKSTPPTTSPTLTPPSTTGIQSPSLPTLPDGGFRTNTYSNRDNSITFRDRTLSDSQVSNLDKTLSYNQRPEVIAGFAKNAELSQARYDDYFRKVKEDKLNARLNSEYNSGSPDPNIIKGLQTSLSDNKPSVPTQPSFKDVNTDARDRARLQFDINKNNESKNLAFIKALQPKDGQLTKPTPQQVVTLGETSGADYDLEQALSYSDLSDEALSGLRTAKDSKTYQQQLIALGFNENIVKKQTLRKFKGN